MIRTVKRRSTRHRLVRSRETVIPPPAPSGALAARSDHAGQRTDGRLDEPGNRAYETSYSISTGYTTNRIIVLP